MMRSLTNQLHRSLMFGSLVVLALIAPRATRAQTSCTASGNPACTVGLTIAMTVLKTTRLEISSSALTLFTGVSATDYVTGSKDGGSLALTAYSNSTTSSVAVTMAAATTNFTAPAGVTKPATTLQWSTNSGTSWNNTTTSGASVLSATNPTAGTGQTIIFRTGLDFTKDAPGNYSLTLNFTITAP